MKKIVKSHFEEKWKSLILTLITDQLWIKVFFQKTGFVSFLVILFSVIVQKINKILKWFSSYGVSDRMALLHRTFTSQVQ